MTEQLKFKGRLREKELELAKVELKIKGLIKSIRDNLDPFAEISDLPADLVAQQAMELAKLRIEYDGLTGEIAAIKKALGM